MPDDAGDGGDVCASFLATAVVKHGAWVAEIGGQISENTAAQPPPYLILHALFGVGYRPSAYLEPTACLGLGTGATFERLGPLGCTGCPASTCGLSTWWSTTALDETWF